MKTRAVETVEWVAWGVLFMLAAALAFSASAAQAAELPVLRIGNEIVYAVAVDLPTGSSPTDRLCSVVDGGADLGCNGQRATVAADGTFHAVGATFRVRNAPAGLTTVFAVRLTMDDTRFPPNVKSKIKVTAVSAMNVLSAESPDRFVVDRTAPAVPQAIEILLEELDQALNRIRERLGLASAEPMTLEVVE